MYTNSIH